MSFIVHREALYIRCRLLLIDLLEVSCQGVMGGVIETGWHDD